MTDKKTPPVAAEGIHQNTYNSAILPPSFCSGFGKFHTNRPNAKYPKPYAKINIHGIRALLAKPQQVEKSAAQWLLPSTLLTRNKEQQQAEGEYWLLWGDIDDNPHGLEAVAAIVGAMVGGCDFEIYTSSSATLENQKCRVLIPLAAPMDFKTWTLAQRALNDALSAAGIRPDAANENAAQLLYLPNRGAIYRTISQRNGQIVKGGEA